jgi:g-D-glutamyl-meso-diaminopimelate peptidase
MTIRNAQAALKRLGLDPGPIDNVLGRQTRIAVQQFQRSQHLPVTGQLDPATWSALVAQLMP